MTNRNLSVLARDAERLRFENRDFTRRRIAHVSDRARAYETVHVRLIERVADVSHFALESQFSTVGSDDAARFLPTMLKRVQAQIGQSRRFRMSVDSEDTTLFA